MDSSIDTDAAIHGLAESMLKVQLNSSSSLSPVATADGEPAPTPSESLASAILDIVADLRKVHASAYAEAYGDNEATPSDVSESASIPSKESAIRRRLWPFKRSLPANEASSSIEKIPRKRSPPPDDGWEALLDIAASSVNRLVAAHVIVEADPSLKAKNPPIFWMLYNGHM